METMRRLWLPALILAKVLGTAATAAEPVVTIQQVQAHQDDKELAYAFARQQVRAREFVGASQALDQVLRIDPSWDAARLFQAVVLFRMAKYEAAREQLSILAGRALTTDQQEEVARYMALIDARTGTESHANAFAPIESPSEAIAKVLTIGRPTPRSEPTGAAAPASRIDSAFGASESGPDPHRSVADADSLLLIEILTSATGEAVRTSPTGDALQVARLEAMQPAVLSQVLATYGYDGAEASGAAPAADRPARLGEAQGSGASRVQETVPTRARFDLPPLQSLGMGQWLLGEIWYAGVRDPVGDEPFLTAFAAPGDSMEFLLTGPFAVPEIGAEVTSLGAPRPRARPAKAAAF